MDSALKKTSKHSHIVPLLVSDVLVRPTFFVLVLILPSIPQVSYDRPLSVQNAKNYTSSLHTTRPEMIIHILKFQLDKCYQNISSSLHRIITTPILIMQSSQGQLSKPFMGFGITENTEAPATTVLTATLKGIINVKQLTTSVFKQQNKEIS